MILIRDLAIVNFVQIVTNITINSVLINNENEKKQQNNNIMAELNLMQSTTF
jgi:hypothetical protein